MVTKASYHFLALVKDPSYAFYSSASGVNGEYTVDNAIAKFFHDGNMLLAASHSTFNDTIDAAFSAIRPRLVDQALVTGNFYAYVS